MHVKKSARFGAPLASATLISECIVWATVAFMIISSRLLIAALPGHQELIIALMTGVSLLFLMLATYLIMMPRKDGTGGLKLPEHLRQTVERYRPPQEPTEFKALPTLQDIIKKITKPDLIGRISKKMLRRDGRTFGANYLDSYGWQASHKAKKPIDANGNPIPWYTYPAQSVIRQIVAPEHRVFEYGCGNSSLWWAAHAHSVISVEHHPEWAKIVAAKAPSNLTVLLKAMQENEETPEIVQRFLSKNLDLPLSGVSALDIEHGLLSKGFFDYANEITKYPPFDIIVVDGMARSLCAWTAAHHLKPNGIIVFDNSDRWQYNPGYQTLSELGFGRVDFWGPGPVNVEPWCTSIFFRTTEWSKPLITINPANKSVLDLMIDAARHQYALIASCDGGNGD